MPLLDIEEFLHLMRRERYHCFVVHAPPMEGKTRFAKRMAERVKCDYLDLLQDFARNPDLKNKIDRVTPKDLKDYLSTRPNFGSLTILDEMDFLWYTWNENDRLEWLNILKLWQQGAFYMVVLPTDSVFENFQMLSQDKKTNRILKLNEVKNLA